MADDGVETRVDENLRDETFSRRFLISHTANTPINLVENPRSLRVMLEHMLAYAQDQEPSAICSERITNAAGSDVNASYALCAA